MKKLLVVLVVAMLFGVVWPIQALGSPEIVSISPGSPASIGTRVVIHARVNNPDSDTRSARICFGDINWCQEDTSWNFERTFDTSGKSAGTYRIFVQVDRMGGNWSNVAEVGVNYTLTTGSQPQPQPTAVPDQVPVVTLHWFDPSSGATVGSTVIVHVEWSCNPNCGAAVVTPSCGSSEAEDTSGRRDFHWNTNGCGAGNQTITVLTRSYTDPNWSRANRQTYTYNLIGTPIANSPDASFWADSSSILSGSCTTLHWRTTNANNVDVNIDGTHYTSGSGDVQVCPRITTRYNMSASNGNGNDAGRSVEIQVSASNPPAAGNDAAGMDIGGFCNHKGYPELSVDRGNALSWGCKRGSEVIQINMNELCAWEFGGTHPYPAFSNLNDAWSGSCNSQPIPGFGTVVTGTNNQSQPQSQQGSGERFGDGSLQLDGGSASAPSGPYVQINTGMLNVRNGPGANYSIIGKAPYEAYYRIVGGPQNGWYQIAYNGGTGWVSGSYVTVGNSSPAQSNQTQSCSSNLLTVGGQARVTPGDPNNMRSGPGTGYSRIGSIPGGATMQVVGGPSCGDGYIWWQVTYNGTTGWTAEGGSGEYWVEPIGSVPAVQQPQVNQSVDPTSMLPSAPSVCVPNNAATSSSWSLIPEAFASERFEPDQCTAYVDEAYNAVERRCLGRPADGGTWDDWFRQLCPEFQISATPSFGDIAVWEPRAAHNDTGHVAIVQNVQSNGTFDVQERNWAQNTPNACGQDHRCGLSTGDGISFIHVICSTRPSPIVATGIPPFLAVPKVIHEQYRSNVFVFYDIDHMTYGGIQFGIAGYSGGSTLFSVDVNWTNSHPNWQNYWWTYVHICSS